MSTAVPPVCYLCGKPLVPPLSGDHVPPRQLFASTVRKQHSPNLLTIPVHRQCNRSYQEDEDYFVNSLAPFGRGSYAGNSKLSEIVGKYHSGREVPLVRMVLAEFERRPSGLVLPGNKVAKRFDGTRIERVAWKIVRGLYFHHHGQCLPASWTVRVEIVPPGEKPPDHFTAVGADPGMGKYCAVFDYKFRTFPEAENLHYWALLLWDQIIIIVMFHDPQCQCERCCRTRDQEAGEPQNDPGG